MNESKVNVQWHLSLQGWLALFALGLALWLTMTYFAAIMAIGWVLFGAVLLSLPLRPLADRLARYRVPRGVTVLGAYLVGIALLVGLGYLLTPIINQQITYLQSNGASLLQTATSRLANSALARWIPSSTTLTQELSQRLNTLATGAVGALATVGDLLLELSVVFILAFFLVAEEGRWRERLILPWFSPARQVRIQQVLENSGRRLSRWVLAQLVVGIFIAITFSIGLALLKVPFALTVGIVSGVLSLIPVPYLGVIAATLLTGVTAASGSPIQVLWVAIYTLVVSAFQAHVLLPILYGRAVGLDSAVVLVALLAGAKMGGLVGIFFAVPAAVIVMTIAQELQPAVVQHSD